jgi:chromosomal replication initiation ATPase DnaA
VTAPAQPPLALAFPRRRAMGREDFVVSPSNAEAAATVADPARWPGGRLALTGPAGAGKSHLVHVLMAETGAIRVDAAALRTEDAPSLVAAGVVAVEDADRLPAPEAERAAFHLLNLAAAEGARVLLTGAAPPARWRAGLPDLASRLAALPVARLAPPDDALLEAVIAKQLDDRRLSYDPALPGWLAARIERSFAAARAAVERLDALSLAERRNLTRRFAAEMLPDLAPG